MHLIIQELPKCAAPHEKASPRTEQHALQPRVRAVTNPVLAVPTVVPSLSLQTSNDKQCFDLGKAESKVVFAGV